MLHELVKLRERNQLTLPAEIAEKLGVKPGSLLELLVSEDGLVELRHARVVTAGTHEAEQEEARAARDIQEGRYIALQGSKEVREHMRQKRAQQAARASAQQLAERIEALQKQMHGFTVELNDTKDLIRQIGTGADTNIAVKG